MMASDVAFLPTRYGRLALPLDRDVLHAVIPLGVLGAYLLLKGETPIYIGRSDHCLRTRLVGHNLRGDASHVLYEPVRTPVEGFRMESYWYHLLRADGAGLNIAHPARPARVDGEDCPFCGRDDEAALTRALAPGSEQQLEEPDASVRKDN